VGSHERKIRALRESIGLPIPDHPYLGPPPTPLSVCRVSGERGTYCEQPRHPEYGLNRFVVVQASSSTGLKAFLRLVVGKQTFLRLAVGKTIVLRPAAGKQSFYEY